jgi:hypothetical protein
MAVADDRYRMREAPREQHSRAGDAPPPRPASFAPTAEPSDTQATRPRSRRALLFAALGAVAVAAIGGAVLSTRGSGAGQLAFSVITDPQQVQEYIRQQPLPPATAQKLDEQAKAQELVVWSVTQRPGWSGQQGQVYSIDNGIDRYQFTILSAGQRFGVVAEKTTATFRFSADSNPGRARMVGTWHTPAGTTSYEMQPGQTIAIRVY